MNWIDRFSQKHRRFGIPNLMAYVTVTMVVLYFAEGLFRIPISSLFAFDRGKILSGQIWRIITFALLPSWSGFFWMVIGALLYYGIGTQLENKWGTPVFTLYYLLGILGAVVAGFLTGYTTNSYINMSLLLAYGLLYPDAHFTLYFVIPIKAKYIAIADLVLYALAALGHIVNKQWSLLVALLFSLLNVFIFFGPSTLGDIKRYFKNRKRKAEYERNLRGGK